MVAKPKQGAHHDLPARLYLTSRNPGTDRQPRLGVLIRADPYHYQYRMQTERQKYLGVGPYERSSERQVHANGYKPKTMQPRVGEVTLAVTQVREGGFYAEALEKGLRSERA